MLKRFHDGDSDDGLFFSVTHFHPLTMFRTDTLNGLPSRRSCVQGLQHEASAVYAVAVFYIRVGLACCLEHGLEGRAPAELSLPRDVSPCTPV